MSITPCVHCYRRGDDSYHNRNFNWYSIRICVVVIVVASNIENTNVFAAHARVVFAISPSLTLVPGSSV